MSAAHVKRGARARPARKPAASTRRRAEAGAGRLAAWGFGGFVALAGIVTLIALDIPAKAGMALGEAVGDAGFRVRQVDVQGIKRMDSAPVYRIAFDQQSTAMPLVDVGAIRERLLRYGWVEDARVSRRLPDTLVVDIVEREPAALWQDRDRLTLIDGEGTVLDRVAISDMPDLPLLSGAGANAHSPALRRLLDAAPTIAPQLASAHWVGGRRWDLELQSGEVIALPEGEDNARTALVKFAKVDKSAGLIGRGLVRFDLRIPGKMVVRLPQGAREKASAKPVTES